MRNKRARPLLARSATASIAAIVALGSLACGSTSGSQSDGEAADQGGLVVTPLDAQDDGDFGQGTTNDTENDGSDSATDSGSGPQGSVIDVAFTWWDGQPATGADLLGQPTVINFFASSCAPCVKELPDFEAVSQQFEGQVRFVGIAAGDEREAAQQLIDETGVTFEIGDDPTNDMFVSLGGFVLPTTYFVDENGTIVANQLGAMNAETLTSAINTNLIGTTTS